MKRFLTASLFVAVVAAASAQVSMQMANQFGYGQPAWFSLTNDFDRPVLVRLIDPEVIHQGSSLIYPVRITPLYQYIPAHGSVCDYWDQTDLNGNQVAAGNYRLGLNLFVQQPSGVVTRLTRSQPFTILDPTG